MIQVIVTSATIFQEHLDGLLLDKSHVSGQAGAIGVHVVPHVVLRRSRAVLVTAPVVLILIQRHVVAWAMIIRLNHVDQKNAQRHYQRNAAWVTGTYGVIVL